MLRPMIKTMTAIALCLGTAVALTACSAPAPADTASPAATGEQGTNVTISVIGSTSVEPLLSALSDVYNAQFSNVSFDIQAPGSGAGIKACIDNTADIGMSSRELKEEEASTGISPTTLCLDGIAVVVHPNNAVSDLTTEQIAAIFKGEITNWKQVGGADSDILLVSREAGSGTRGAFEEILKLTKDDKSLVAEDKAIFSDSTNGVAMNVADKENAIGYVSLGSLGDTVKALSVNGVACNAQTVKDATYAVARPFLLISGQNAQPQAQAFIDWTLSAQAQAVVTEHKYISIR